MTPEEIMKLKQLYRKTNGGHTLLAENEFQEYAALRKKEYLDTKVEKLKNPKVKSVKAVKDDAGDIVGWLCDRIPEDNHG